ncbi:sigma-54 interaction domain-containing protein [Bacillus sp. CGMCC 1.16607]|uniref:sigma-54 interaction domain-containing protein n=1 Tax=Bacillus sp. CGMCC 1.16607 TaxID=3351842 RepID=UPI00362F30AF
MFIATYKHEELNELALEKTIFAKRTINVSIMEKLLQISSHTFCYVASNTYEASIESIEMLKGFGIQLKMIPYPRCKDELNDEISTVITHDLHLVDTSRFSTIIDIGFRPLDFSSIIEVAFRLQLPISTIGVYKATNMDEIVRLNFSLSQSNQQLKNINQQIEAIVNASQDGMVTVNSKNIIIQMNTAILDYLKTNSKGSEFVGKYFTDLFSSFDSFQNKVHYLYNLNGYQLLVQQLPIPLADGELGTLFVFREINQLQQREQEVRRKIHAPGFVSRYQFSHLIGSSATLNETIEKALKLGQFEQPILILGENGTGKEIFAHSLHRVSKRRDQPFVPINFAGLPESLAESELFGYEDGAFTGAKKGGKPGFFELAHNGVIFLDEIGDASPSIQASLLRVLQEKQILRVGGTQLIPVDVRIIAATNKDLLKLVEKGAFREDLYYRLNVLPLQLPALRERKDDILPLVDFFFSKQFSKSIILDDKVKEVLLSYSWPGNIRELENTVYYLSAIIKNDRVQTTDLPAKFFNQIQEKDYSIDEQLEKEGSLTEFFWILSYLYLAKQNNWNTGRTKMEAYFKEETSTYLSAQQIKSRMLILKKYHLIEIGTTRQGSWITKLGIQAINTMRNSLG